MDINTDKIRELADLALEKNLAELIVQDGEKSVTIKLPGQPAQHVVHAAPAQPSVYPVQAGSPEVRSVTAAKSDVTKGAAEDRLHKITSPMVGTFYAAPSPDSPPFVSIGQTISKGQSICIIEAMKMMNELEAEVSGKVVKVLVENGQPVEFGQILMLVEPA